MDRLQQVGNIKVIKVVDITKAGPKQKFVVLSKVIVCICCGAKNVRLIKLHNCSHKQFLESNFKSKINFQVTFVCHYCHALLKKINDFKNQVEKCLTDRQMMLNYQAKLTAFSKPVLLDIEPEPIDKLADIPHIYFEVPAYKPDKPVKEEPQELKEENDDMDISDTVVEKIPMTVDFIKRKAEAMLQAANQKHRDIKEGLLMPIRSVLPSDHGKPVKKTQKKLKPLIEEPIYLEPSDSDSGSIEITSPTKRLDDKIRIVRVTRQELEKERDKERRDKKYMSMPFKCEDCIVGFPQEKLLIGHLKNHDMSKGGYVCEVCLLVYTSEQLLRKHQQFHWKRYQCIPCGKMFKTSLFFCKSHYNKNHVVNGEFIDRTFECRKDECNFICTNSSQYRGHRRKHKGRVACNQCGNTYTSTGTLKQHIETVHENVVRVFKCIDCEKQYKTAVGLSGHRQSVHEFIDKSPFYCHLCPKQFQSQAILKQHLRRHKEAVNGKKFKCDICSAKYNSKTDIRNHIESVHLKNRYECQHCDKVYHIHSALSRHVKEKHDPDQRKTKILCHLCGKEFKSKRILQGHMVTHTGERPYKCCFCSATFGFSAALYTHKKLVHKQPKIRRQIN